MTEMVSVEELDAMPRGCAWRGCTNRFKGNLPPDWVNLLTWWTPQPDIDATIGDIVLDDRCRALDATLCGKHAEQLDVLLGSPPRAGVVLQRRVRDGGPGRG